MAEVSDGGKTSLFLVLAALANRMGAVGEAVATVCGEKIIGLPKKCTHGAFAKELAVAVSFRRCTMELSGDIGQDVETTTTDSCVASFEPYLRIWRIAR